MAQKDGDAPLYVAANHGNMECVRVLLSEGAKLEQTNKVSGVHGLQVLAAL